jgi:hypothetical protein
MLPFDTVFPELARDETRSWHILHQPGLPSGTYVLREFYCDEPGCDCRRVLLQVHWAEQRRVVATMSYAFEPPRPPFEKEGQLFLDPLNPQSQYSDALMDMFRKMVREDVAYRERLIRHYALWKRVVEDSSHPRHETLKSVARAAGGARPRQETVRREGPRVGPNAPCPCGSGKKSKRCCRP